MSTNPYRDMLVSTYGAKHYYEGLRDLIGGIPLVTSATPPDLTGRGFATNGSSTWAGFPASLVQSIVNGGAAFSIVFYAAVQTLGSPGIRLGHGGCASGDWLASTEVGSLGCDLCCGVNKLANNNKDAVFMGAANATVKNAEVIHSSTVWTGGFHQYAITYDGAGTLGYCLDAGGYQPQVTVVAATAPLTFGRFLFGAYDNAGTPIDFAAMRYAAISTHNVALSVLSLAAMQGLQAANPIGFGRAGGSLGSTILRNRNI